MEIEWRLAEAMRGHVVALWADGSVTIHDSRPAPRQTQRGIERPVAEFRRRIYLPSRQAILERLAAVASAPGEDDDTPANS